MVVEEENNRNLDWSFSLIYSQELKKNRALILATRNMTEASAVGDRIVIINKGVMVSDGSVEFLSRVFGTCNSTKEGIPLRALISNSIFFFKSWVTNWLLFKRKEKNRPSPSKILLRYWPPTCRKILSACEFLNPRMRCSFSTYRHSILRDFLWCSMPSKRGLQYFLSNVSV